MHPQRIRAKKNADQREALLKQARAERDDYRKALEALMAFGGRLMVSDDEAERGIGCCVCEGARIVTDSSVSTNKHSRDCLRRRAELGRYVCTCGLTDKQEKAA
jgi:hypothetical protein